MALRTDSRERTTDAAAGPDDRDVVRDYRGTGVTPVLIAVTVAAILFVVFLAQSTDAVPIEFLVWDGEAPLYVVLLVTMAATALVTLAVSGIWRRRRRRTRTEREELGRLRRRAS